MADDNDQPEGTHIPGVRPGNEVGGEGSEEPGRHDKGTSGADRPAGGSTARDATGVNPQEPIDPESPNLPPA
ncbi:MAG: hypothetical protein M3010_05560 [Candidatus Dormibacteraeota bacterium]|nr:hypothetical protein [Candidatus Dormibacteraeota bacterium]